MVKNILCFGDSNTFGYDTLKDSRFPWGVRWTSILQEKLGSDYRIIEEGMGGRTTVWEDPIENLQSGNSGGNDKRISTKKAEKRSFCSYCFSD